MSAPIIQFGRHGFLDLPAEVRNMIYRYLLPNKVELFPTDALKAYEFPEEPLGNLDESLRLPSNASAYTSQDAKDWYSMCLTCKTVNGEVKEWFDGCVELKGIHDRHGLARSEWLLFAPMKESVRVMSLAPSTVTESCLLEICLLGLSRRALSWDSKWLPAVIRLFPKLKVFRWMLYHPWEEFGREQSWRQEQFQILKMVLRNGVMLEHVLWLNQEACWVYYIIDDRKHAIAYSGGFEDRVSRGEGDSCKYEFNEVDVEASIKRKGLVLTDPST